MSLFHNTLPLRLANEDGSNAIQDIIPHIVMHPTIIQVNDTDIDGLAARLTSTGGSLSIFRVKTTPRDVRQACDTAVMGKLVAELYPFMSSVHHIVIKSVTNLDTFLPRLLSLSSLTHLNISAQHSTAELWKILPVGLLSLRCTLIDGPLHNAHILPNLYAFSDHSVSPDRLIGPGIIKGVLNVAPNLAKFVRKQHVLFSISDSDTDTQGMVYLEQCIVNGLCTNHGGGHAYNVGLSFNNVMMLNPFLSEVINTHPMVFASEIIVSHINNCPERAAIIDNITLAFPNASIKIMR